MSISAWSGAADDGGRRGAGACGCCQRGALCVGEYGNDAAEFNQVGHLFRENGVERFASTQVLCYPNAQWRLVAGSAESSNGFRRWWVPDPVRHDDVHQPTKLINSAQVDRFSTAVALSTLLHETIHRQGVHNERETECLASWLTGHVVLAWTGSETKALRAFDYSRRYAKQLESQYRTTNAACEQIAHARGIHPIKIDGGGRSDPRPLRHFHRLRRSNRCRCSTRSVRGH